jgi:1-acyl-sn-glycerol-3-phosphate acyltransferase
MTDSHPPLPDPTSRNAVWLSTQLFLRLVFTFCFRYRCRHLERIPESGGGLVLSNHQSFLDPLLIGLPLQRPVSYIARDSLFRVPIIGWILRNTYVMPIHREAAGAESVREALRRMKAGYLVGMFPEGTRSTDGQLGEIKPGFVALARRSKLPIYPVGIAGAYRVMPKGGLRFYCRKVRVVYGEPIPADKVQELARKGNEEEFLATIREHIQMCLDEANAWLNE